MQKEERRRRSSASSRSPPATLAVQPCVTCLSCFTRSPLAPLSLGLAFSTFLPLTPYLCHLRFAWPVHFTKPPSRGKWQEWASGRNWFPSQVPDQVGQVGCKRLPPGTCLPRARALLSLRSPHLAAMFVSFEAQRQVSLRLVPEVMDSFVCNLEDQVSLHRVEFEASRRLRLCIRQKLRMTFSFILRLDSGKVVHGCIRSFAVALDSRVEGSSVTVLWVC